MRDEDVVMTLLEGLPPSYEYPITALETLPMKDLTMAFVTARLMHEVSKRKDKEPQGDDATMVSMQGVENQGLLLNAVCLQEALESLRNVLPSII